MEDNIFYPISIIAKDDNNSSLYEISEYVMYNGKITINLTVHGNDIDEIVVNSTKAIQAMKEAIAKREKENDVNNNEDDIFNLKEEMADGR